MNNDATGMFNGPLRTSRDRLTAMGNAISPGQPTIINVGTPSSCEAIGGDQLPQLGAMVWDGHRVTGIVDENFRQRYREAAQRMLIPIP